MQEELNKFPDKLMHAQNQMNLVEFERPACTYNKNLLDENWVKDAKAALNENCNLDKITTMKREDLAELISYESNTAFDEAFKAVEHHENVNAQEAPVPVLQNNAPEMN